MYYKKHQFKVQDFLDPLRLSSGKNDSGTEKLNTEEGRKKAQTLFSKKFMDYLSNKQLNQNSEVNKILGKTHDHSLPLSSKEKTTSSDETSASDSSKKSYKKVKKKGKETVSVSPPSFEFNYACRSKLIQCNLVKDEEEVIVSEELKPFLMNMTLLLQEFKQNWASSPESDHVYNLVSKITILITEFSRRQIKIMRPVEKGDHFKNLEKTMEAILELVNEYKKNVTLNMDNEMREFKKIEKEIAVKDSQISEAKKLEETDEPDKLDMKASDINLRVKNSILNNERIKALIKFNQTRIKKYKKSLLEREWTKHKLENEILQLQKKVCKTDSSDDGEKPLTLPESSVKGEKRWQYSPPKVKSPKSKKGKKKSQD